MKKSAKSENKDMREITPFNFCDRHCERCEDFKSRCRVYQEESQFKLQCVMEGRDPSDPKVIFEHVGKAMASTLEMLKKKMKEEGIEIKEEEMEIYEQKEIERDEQINKHPLLERCLDIAEELDEFLSTFQITLPDMQYIASSLSREMKELYFYVPLITAKTGRALFSKMEDEENGEEDEEYSDALVSAALGYRSLQTVGESLKRVKQYIGSSEVVWAMRLNNLLSDIEQVKKIYKKTFPGMEKFSHGVIFHGRHD